jgi:glyoxylase-like metal-dependent hydrolase (beta-lactamase superfamily II)
MDDVMAEDEFKTIIDGVRVIPVRSPTLPPATHTNVWVLGDHHVTIVDPASPYPDEQERMDELLEETMVERIVLTHHHVDHVSGALAIQATTGAKIAAHPLTAELIDITVDEILNEGDVIGTDAGFWRVLHTPGHAPGHICLYNAGIGTVVAGDMVAGTGTILIDPSEGDLGQYLDSLNRLKELNPRRLLPAHGPVLESAIERLDEYISHRHMRTEQIASALAVKPSTPIELAQTIYASLIPASYMPMAARQVLAHLNWLEAQGRVVADGQRFVIVSR